MSNFHYSSILLPRANINWVIAKAILEPDGQIYQRAISQAYEKSKYTMSASQAGFARSLEEKFQMQLMGCLAEIYVQEFLIEFLQKNNLENQYYVLRYDDIRTDGFRSPLNEFDIIIFNKKTKCYYKVESRSSITHDRTIFRGIEDFDIIGPYSSIAKKSEEYTDIYLRPLYSYLNFKTEKYDKSKFKNYLASKQIDLYIVAGCFKEEMILKGYDKSMGQNQTTYRVIKILQSNDVVKFHKKLLHLICSSSNQLL